MTTTKQSRDEWWVPSDVFFLKNALEHGMTYAEAAGFLSRDEDEVRKKAKQMKIRTDDYGITVIAAYAEDGEKVAPEGFLSSSLLHLHSRAMDSQLRSISLNSLFSTELVLSLENFPASVAWW